MGNALYSLPIIVIKKRFEGELPEKYVFKYLFAEPDGKQITPNLAPSSEFSLKGPFRSGIKRTDEKSTEVVFIPSGNFHSLEEL